MNVLVLGASGMLGNAVFRVLSESGELRVLGTARSVESEKYFVPELRDGLRIVADLLNVQGLVDLLELERPDVVINCTSARQTSPDDVLTIFSIYAALPQRLNYVCRRLGVRLVQFSSDGVFSGEKGAYTEDDLPDATDVYGTAKLLGEVDGAGSITLRTSMIGHELRNKSGLLEWFLAQQGSCKCYTRAVFSGLPTVELAKIVRDNILPRSDLNGIYHLAANPISKFDLLSLVAREYASSIDLLPDDTVVIDRSLVAERFRSATGYVAPDWPALLSTMHSYDFGLVRQ